MENKKWLDYLANENKKLKFKNVNELLKASDNQIVSAGGYSYILTIDQNKKIKTIHKIKTKLEELWYVAHEYCFDRGLFPNSKTIEGIFDSEYFFNNAIGEFICLANEEYIKVALLTLKSKGYVIKTNGTCYRKYNTEKGKSFSKDKYIKSIIAEYKECDTYYLDIKRRFGRYKIYIIELETKARRLLVKGKTN